LPTSGNQNNFSNQSVFACLFFPPSSTQLSSAQPTLLKGHSRNDASVL
jgi:hypothetical protein